MTLRHQDVWQAIDALAARHGLSLAALARRAGLDPTSFNPSKRMLHGRARWPSTESLARLLQATATPIEDFLTPPGGGSLLPLTLPRLDAAAALTLPSSPRDAVAAVICADARAMPAYPRGTILLLRRDRTPSPGERVAMMTMTGKLCFGTLGQRRAKQLQLRPFKGGAARSFTSEEIGWIHPIIWAGTGA